jgi:hypothetical protein
MASTATIKSWPGMCDTMTPWRRMLGWVIHLTCVSWDVTRSSHRI